VRSEQAPIIENDQVEEIWVEPEDEVVIQTPQVSPMTSEDDPTVSLSNSNYILPPKKNKGTPPKRYVLENGTSKEIKYLIANYTTTNKLPKQLKEFNDKMLSIAISDSVKETINDPKWVHAMEEELNALYKNET
jgi:hypothetical protein